MKYCFKHSDHNVNKPAQLIRTGFIHPSHNQIHMTTGLFRVTASMVIMMSPVKAMG